MFGRLAMGFAYVRAGTRVLMLVLVQADLRGVLRVAHAQSVSATKMEQVYSQQASASKARPYPSPPGSNFDYR